jgi:NADH:ubiquinone oxidoreductase subunit 5 (subunit L)/multisubunit Na+/H+ antiporter MnhA subunit
MMVSVGLGELGADASMSHLMSHASFKAALFLSAGVIIMSAGHNQQMARYGSLSALHCSLLCVVTMLVASLSLMGLIETSGFYSKETIINYSFISFNTLSDYAHTLLITAALFTCMYTVKLFVQSFLYDFSGYNLNVGTIHPVKHIFIVMALSALLLDIISKIWVGTSLLSGILFFIPWGAKTLPFGLLIAGMLTATVSVSSRQYWIVRFCATRWGFDQMYARNVVHLVLDLGRITWSTGDKGLFMLNNLRVR